MLRDTEFTITNHVGGYDAIQLSVPIVAEQVIISAAGTISNTESRILQES